MDFTKFKAFKSKGKYYVQDDEGVVHTLGEAQKLWCPHVSLYALRQRILHGDSWVRCMRQIEAKHSGRVTPKYEVDPVYITNCLDRFGNTIIHKDRFTDEQIREMLKGYKYKIRLVLDEEFGRDFYVVSLLK